MLYKKKIKFIRRRRRLKYINYLNIINLKTKNQKRLIRIAKYIKYLNLMSRRRVRFLLEDLRFLRQVKSKRRRGFRGILFNLRRSKKRYKKFFFLIKRIARKEQIKRKRKLLRKKICIIMFKKTNTNFFIVVTDLNGKVITYSSAGTVSYSNNSKKKNSVFLVNYMMPKIISILKSLRVDTLRIVLKSNINKHVYQAMRYINACRLKIEHVAFLKPIPHHSGQRKKKLKRL
jgi:ribosomal protein S11